MSQRSEQNSICISHEEPHITEAFDTPQNEVRAAKAVRDIKTEELEEQLKGPEKEVYFVISFS